MLHGARSFGVSMTIKSIGRLLLCLVVCLGIGVVGSLSTKPEIAGWYAGLAKPFWTPPPFAFPIAWTTLYILMAVAFWRLWIGPRRQRCAAGR